MLCVSLFFKLSVSFNLRLVVWDFSFLYDDTFPRCFISCPICLRDRLILLWQLILFCFLVNITYVIDNRGGNAPPLSDRMVPQPKAELFFTYSRMRKCKL